MLKRRIPKNVDSMQIEKVVTYNHRVFFDAFVFSLYFIIFSIFYDLIVTFIPVSRIFDNEDDIFIFYRNVRKSSAREISLKNEIKNIIKYKLFTNVAKDNR